MIALVLMGTVYVGSSRSADFLPKDPASLIEVEVSDLELNMQVFEDLRAHGHLKLAARSPTSAFLYAQSQALSELDACGIEYTILLDRVTDREIYIVSKSPGVLRASLETYGLIISEDDSHFLVEVRPEDAFNIHQLPVKKKLPVESAPGLPLRLPALRIEKQPRAPLAYTPLIQTMVDSVSTSRLYTLLNDLTGENPVTIGGQPYTISSRFSHIAMCRRAGEFIRERFETMGIDVDFDYFRFTTLMNAVGFVDSLTGWAVGKQMTIVSTQDGGQLWTEQHLGAQRALNDIFMLNRYRGCVVGNNGLVMRTDDGQNWQRISIGISDNLNAVFFMDSLTACACGQAGTIIKSDDGGATWSSMASGTAEDLHAIWFVNADVGWSVGNAGLILKTEDGGASWDSVSSPVSDVLRDVAFASESKGWACGLSGKILRTEDGGTWQEIPTPVSGDLYSLSFVSEVVGWACGPGGTLIKTSNGGASWDDLSLGVDLDLRDVFFVDAAEGWIAGNELIYHSSSGGVAWEDQSDAVNTGSVNVVATIPGTSRPDEIYIICGHYDCTSETPYSYAPGADDNATGTGAVIEAARVLKDYLFEATLRFVCFSWEEQGLIGSGAYVAECYERGDSIIGALNFDMIGYVQSPPEDIDIGYNDFSEWLADTYETAAGLYVPSLPVYKRYTPESSGSDHASFWDYGYPAFLGIEGPAYLNPYYHTTADRVSTLDFDFYRDVVKGAVATLAELAVIDASMSSIVQAIEPRAPRVSPNPGRDEITIEMSALDPGAGAIRVYDVNGRLVSTVKLSVEGGMVRGVWRGRDKAGRPVSPGIYFVKTTEESPSSKIVLLR